MKTILPDKVKLDAYVRSDGKVHFVYEETFSQDVYGDTTREDLLQRTLAIVNHAIAAMDVSCCVIQNTLSISGVVERDRFGNMMISEFMGWGTIGEMKMRDVLISAFVAGSRA